MSPARPRYAVLAWEASAGGAFPPALLGADDVQMPRAAGKGSGDNKLYCLDIDPASPTYQMKLWDYTGGQVKSSPAEFNGNIFVGCNDHTFVSVNADTGALHPLPIRCSRTPGRPRHWKIVRQIATRAGVFP